MISSTTLILATLVFNAASILGAPIRMPSTAPEVEVRSPIAQPTVPRVAVVDAQPVHKRSAEGTANRPRLAREVVPEHDTRDTASESVEIRDSSLPEVENIVRRFPRRHLAEFYERRSPEPAPAPDTPSAPSSQPQARSDPPLGRRFPRRALYERHEQRSAEPTPPLEVRNEYDPDGHFVREHNPELMAKRNTIPTDNVPREPEPAPAPAENSEKVRRFPRRVYADYYAKRQDTQDPASPAEPSPATPSSTSSASTPTGTTTSTTTVPTASGLPANLEKAIADAIVKGSTVHGGSTNGKTSSYSDTTITIKITHQANSDVTGGKPPKGSSNPPPTGTSSPSATSTPTSTGTASSSASSGSPTGGPATPPTEPPTGSTADDSTEKPKEEESKPGATGAGSSPSGSPDGGEDPAQPDAETRDLGDSNAADQPLSKRKLGLSGALWASWSRRNFQKD